MEGFVFLGKAPVVLGEFSGVGLKAGDLVGETGVGGWGSKSGSSTFAVPGFHFHFLLKSGSGSGFCFHFLGSAEGSGSSTFGRVHFHLLLFTSTFVQAEVNIGSRVPSSLPLPCAVFAPN